MHRLDDGVSLVTLLASLDELLLQPAPFHKWLIALRVLMNPLAI